MLSGRATLIKIMTEEVFVGRAFSVEHRTDLTTLGATSPTFTSPELARQYPIRQILPICKQFFLSSDLAFFSSLTHASGEAGWEASLILTSYRGLNFILLMRPLFELARFVGLNKTMCRCHGFLILHFGNIHYMIR